MKFIFSILRILLFLSLVSPFLLHYAKLYMIPSYRDWLFSIGAVQAILIITDFTEMYTYEILFFGSVFLLALFFGNKVRFGGNL